MSWNADSSSTNNKIAIPGATELIARYARLSSTVLQLGESAATLLKIAEQVKIEQKENNPENTTTNNRVKASHK